MRIRIAIARKHQSGIVTWGRVIGTAYITETVITKGMIVMLVKINIYVGVTVMLLDASVVMKEWNVIL